MAALHNKISLLERSQTPSPKFQPPQTTQGQNADEEDELFRDTQESIPSETDNQPIPNTRILSIDDVISGFSLMPIPSGWVMGTLPPSAPIHSLAPAHSASIQQAKLFLHNKKIQNARGILVELVKNNVSSEYPFALYWLGIVELHENHLDRALDCFKKTYHASKKRSDLESQKLCVASLLRMAQTYWRQKNVSQAVKFFTLCRKKARRIHHVLPKHIQSGIKKMRIEIKTLKPSQISLSEPSSERIPEVQEAPITESRLQKAPNPDPSDPSCHTKALRKKYLPEDDVQPEDEAKEGARKAALSAPEEEEEPSTHKEEGPTVQKKDHVESTMEQDPSSDAPQRGPRTVRLPTEGDTEDLSY